MKAITFLFVSAIAAMNVNAAPVQLTKPHQSEIKVKVKELFQEIEKPYHCTLLGYAENPAWFSNNETLEVDLTAGSLENAAKLALTPYVIEGDVGSDRMKVVIKGQGFFVNAVECKPIKQRAI